MRWIIGVLFLFVYGFIPFEDPAYPLDFFQAPVNQPLRLSGTFGELRPNHFHSGIDIKGAIGVSILAAGEGFIARIRVAPDGYGNHLYIEHPNGYTSVYAHLQEFSPEIEAYVREMQFRQETFEIELFPGKDQFPVRRGQVVGKMGSTGHSFGPHLHFEIRKTTTDRPVNPLLFGLKVQDQIPPRLHEIKMYEFDPQGRLVKSSILPLIFKNGTYRVQADSIKVAAKWVGIAVKAYDHMDGVSNWNGIYQLDLFRDGALCYGFKMESFGFDETRYINAHLDYQEQRSRGSYFHRCFTLPGNQLSIYQSPQNGLISLTPGKASTLQATVKDVAGNESNLEIRLFTEGQGPVIQAPRTPYQFFLPFDKPHVIDNYGLYLNFPANIFYEDLFMQYAQRKDFSPGILSLTHVLHNESFPVHKEYVLGIRPDPIPMQLRPKAFIAHRLKGGIVNYGGQWQDDGMLVTTVNTLGEFAVMLDTVPPRIEVDRFSTDMRRYASMSFRIRDNISASGNLPNLKYRASIDGQWVLMSYDEKNRRITHAFSREMASGSHALVLEVSDAMGNVSVFKRNFFR